MKQSDERIEQLKIYFEKRSDAVMAFVFGSHSEGRSHGGSDWDIAVYFKPEKGQLEWEACDRVYPQEDRLWSDCMDILKTDNVDLVVLNRAPATIAEVALQGTALVIKDHALWLKFMLIVSQEAEDYRGFVHEFFEISERSGSLASHDREHLERTVQFMREQMTLYSYFQTLPQKEYEQNIHKRNELERWVENIVNALIDCAKIILASEKKLIPSTYREALQQAIRLLNISEEHGEHFERWVKLRNVLAHEYLDIKWKRIADFIQSSEPIVHKFVDATIQFLKKEKFV